MNLKIIMSSSSLLYIKIDYAYLRASLVAQLVKNLPAMQEQWSIPGLGRSAGEGIGYPLQWSWASLVAQLVKNPPTMRETWVWTLGWEDPLEKGKATHSSILAWRIPWTVYNPWGCKESDMTEWLSLHFSDPIHSLLLHHWHGSDVFVWEAGSC